MACGGTVAQRWEEITARFCKDAITCAASRSVSFASPPCVHANPQVSFSQRVCKPTNLFGGRLRRVTRLSFEMVATCRITCFTKTRAFLRRIFLQQRLRVLLLDRTTRFADPHATIRIATSAIRTTAFDFVSSHDGDQRFPRFGVSSAGTTGRPAGYT
jgi:hypothetical protein